MNQPSLFRLTAGQFRGIASGLGDQAALAVLSAAQLSKRVLLVQLVRSLHGSAPYARPAWKLLDHARGRSPDTTRELLARPFVDIWAGRYLLSIERAHPTLDYERYLVGLAAAAAIRAEVDFELECRTTDGTLAIPGLGSTDGLGSGRATMCYRPPLLTLTGPDRSFTVDTDEPRDTKFWHGCRSINLISPAGATLIEIDEHDPFRTCFRCTLAPRLTTEGCARLHRRLADAWQVIAADYPAYLPTIQSSVRLLVPLMDPSTGSTSATAQRAFGVIATSMPDNTEELVQILIHEAQHAKLGGLLDMVTLVDPSDTSVHHAPWRSDPRPVAALLQGAYAHAGVADYWRVRRRHHTRDRTKVAAFQFSYWRQQTRLAVDTIARSGALTELGTRFISCLAETLDGWRSGEDARLSAGIADLTTAIAVDWRLRWHRVVEAEISKLVAAWLAGSACPTVSRATAAPADIAGPTRLRGVAAELHEALSGDGPDPRRRRDPPPDDEDAWVDLALTLVRDGLRDAAWAMAERPELVRAILTRVRPAPDPAKLGSWLAEGLRRGGPDDYVWGGSMSQLSRIPSRTARVFG